MANVIKHKRGTSDPSPSDLVVGEIGIRTDVGKLFTKTDSGTVSEIAGGGSDIIINTLSSSSATGGGSATFNGSAYRFTLSQPPSVSAQQLLVSIAGVIQKPVAGSNQPSEGFSVSGNDIILASAPATGTDFFILTFKSLGVSEPADNTVTSAKIVDGTIVGSDLATNIDLADNQKIRLGGGNDLQIYHDGTHSYLDNSTGSLFIRGDAIKLRNAAGNEAYIECFANGAVKLSYDDSIKFETTSSGVTITGNVDAGSGQFILNDSGRIRLGSAQDFEIYHDGSNSLIKDAGTGALVLSTNQLLVRNAAVNEYLIQAVENAGVKLYYDNSKKLETTSVGVNVTGNLIADCNNGIIDPDSYTNHFAVGAIQDGSGWGVNGITFGAGTGHMAAMGSNNASLYMAYGDGSNTNSLTTYQKVTSAGAVELYYNGTKKLQTDSAGTIFYDDIFLGDSLKANFGASADLEIFHDGSNSYIKDAGTGSLLIRGSAVSIQSVSGEAMIEGVADGAVTIKHDNSTKFQTDSAGVIITGNLYQVDNDKLSLGNLSDLTIFHDGTNSHIKNDTNALILRSDALRCNNNGNTETMIKADANGAVELYHDNGRKFSTAAGGLEFFGRSVDCQVNWNNSSNGQRYGGVYGYLESGVPIMSFLKSNGSYSFVVNDNGVVRTYGTVRPNANNSYDLGTTSHRWANIYTNDLNLSNEGSSNDVDGTWGSFTIQEGAESLFLINRRNGKKYKFNLTEVL